jgi:tetratricopeptide (TPR) repeat protein
LLAGNVQYVAADNAYLWARAGAINADERVRMTELAVKRNPYNDIYRAEVGLAYSDAAIARLAGQLGDPNTSVEDARALFLKSEQSLLDTIAFVPPEYDNYVFLSNLYNTMAEYFDRAYLAKAIEIARKGTEVEPYGPAVRAELARALAESGKVDEAIKEAAYAVKLDPGYAQGALLLSDIYEKQGELQKALEVLKGVEAFKPGQTGVAEAIRRIETSLTAQ